MSIARQHLNVPKSVTDIPDFLTSNNVTWLVDLIFIF